MGNGGASRRMIPLRRKFLYAGITGFIFAGSIEGASWIALWVLGPGRAPLEVTWGEGRTRSHVDVIYEPDEQLFYRLRPNLALPKSSARKIFDLRTNSFGLRGDAIHRVKQPDVVRVLCVGDSCTFGSGAGADETYPAQLERSLERLRPDLQFEVLNVGTPGWSSHQGRRYLEIEGYDFAPDFVVFTFGYNDSSPAVGIRRLSGKVKRLSDREYAATRAGGRSLGVARLARRLAGHRSGPHAEEAAGRSEIRRVPIEDYRDNLAAVVSGCVARGIQAVIVVWPLRSQAGGPPSRNSIKDERVPEYQQAARAVARGQRVPTVDLVPVVIDRPGLFLDSVHMKPKGYGVVAEQIAERILELVATHEGG